MVSYKFPLCSGKPWFLNLRSVAFNLVYSKFALQESKPTFDLTVFTYNHKKNQVLGFYFDCGVCVGKQDIFVLLWRFNLGQPLRFHVKITC